MTDNPAGRDSADETAGFVLEDVGVTVDGATLLTGVSARLPAGSFSVILGPSGGGKSTLLRLLNRLIDPTVGRITLAGTDLQELDVRALRRRVGIVVQQPRLSDGSVAHNLGLPQALGSITAEQDAARRPVACELAGLAPELLERDITRLSGGERQRVALARALMLEPEAILLDEPTSALDPTSARALMAALDTLRQREMLTIVMVTHRPSEVRGRADQVLVVEGGRIVEQGTADDVLDAPRHATTRELLGGSEASR